MVRALIIVLCIVLSQQWFKPEFKEEVISGKCLIKVTHHHGERLEGTYVDEYLIVGLKSYKGLAKYKNKRVTVRGKTVTLPDGKRNIEIRSEEDVSLQEPVDLIGTIVREKKSVLLRDGEGNIYTFNDLKDARNAERHRGKEVCLRAYLAGGEGSKVIDELIGVFKGKVLLLGSGIVLLDEFWKGLERGGYRVVTTIESGGDLESFKAVVLCSGPDDLQALEQILAGLLE